MHAIGIDVGGTATKIGRVDRSGRLLDLEEKPTVTVSAEAFFDALAAMVGDLGKENASGIGLGLPGLRSKRTGVVDFSPNLPFLNGINVEQILSARVGLPVVGRNDADMSAWGEFACGAGVGASDLACITLGTGVGCGLILNGLPYSGHSGYAGEAGHMIVDPDGLPCPCGGQGCLETVASATGIVALARRRLETDPSGRLQDLGQPLTAKAVHNAALQGDSLALATLDEAGRYLGIACANLIALLNLEIIVIGGGVAAAGELLLEPARTHTRMRTYKAAFDACRIVPAKLGNNAGIIGAALLALGSGVQNR